MPLGRSITPGLVYTIDLSKIADRENPLKVEAAIYDSVQEPTVIEWGDGDTSVIDTGTSFPEHTYNAVGVYTVVMRSATGHLPRVRFCSETSAGVTPSKNVTLAVTSIDHFDGWCGQMAGSSGAFSCLNTSNLQYIAPKYLCGSFWNSMNLACYASGVSQPADSFSFEFQICPDYSYTFTNCANLTGATPKFHEGVTNLRSTFQGCTGLTYLTEVPTTVTNIAYAFNNCPNLEGTFPAIPSVTGSMRNAFYACVKLGGALPDIPSGVTSIQSAFYACRAATAFPSSIANTITDVTQAFYDCRGINVSTNSAPELWNSTNYPIVTNHNQCFGGLTNLANYADIPSDWK